jgi:hypothetical protein
VRNFLIVLGAVMFGLAMANTQLPSAHAQDAASGAPHVEASPTPLPVVTVSPSPVPVEKYAALEPVAAPDGGWLPWVFGALFALSELLAAIPAVKANSIFQLVAGILKALAGKK